MTQEVLDFLGGFFAQFWRLFNSWYIPGTNVTPAGLLLFCSFVPIAMKFIKNIIGLGASGASVSSVKNKFKE